MAKPKGPRIPASTSRERRFNRTSAREAGQHRSYWQANVQMPIVKDTRSRSLQVEALVWNLRPKEAATGAVAWNVGLGSALDGGRGR